MSYVNFQLQIKWKPQDWTQQGEQTVFSEAFLLYCRIFSKIEIRVNKIYCLDFLPYPMNICLSMVLDYLSPGRGEGGGGGGLEDFGRSNGFQVEWTKDQSLPSECKAET